MLFTKISFLFFSFIAYKQYTRARGNGNPVDQVAVKGRSSLWSSKRCTCIIWRDPSSHSYSFSCQSSGSYRRPCVLRAWHEHQAGFIDKNENTLYSGDISWKGLPFKNFFSDHGLSTNKWKALCKKIFLLFFKDLKSSWILACGLSVTWETLLWSFFLLVCSSFLRWNIHMYAKKT